MRVLPSNILAARGFHPYFGSLVEPPIIRLKQAQFRLEYIVFHCHIQTILYVHITSETA